MSDEPTLVQYAVESGLARITLDSPANRNALSGTLMAALRRSLDDALADDQVRVILLGHTGSVFCSGMDLREAKGADARSQGINVFPEILQTIWESPKPVIVRVAGAARAGGIGLIAACDIAVSGESAHFALTEVRLGLIPALISVVLRQKVNPPALLELSLTGAKFGAAKAAEIGLINSCLPDADLDAEVARYVAMLVAGGPIALRSVKQVLRAEPTGGMADQFAAMQSVSAGFFASDEGQEGIASFAQKRPAAWIPA